MLLVMSALRQLSINLGFKSSEGIHSLYEAKNSHKISFNKY